MYPIVFFEQETQSVAFQLNNILGIITTWAKPICMIALIFCGIGFMFAGKKGADGAKEVFKNICIGAAIVLGVTVIWDIIDTFVNGIHTL